MKRASRVAVGLALCAALPVSWAVDYKSAEFRDRKSRVSNVYICAIVGFRMQYEPKAYQLLEKFERLSKVPEDKSSMWKADAELWWDSERSGFDLKGFWTGQCAAPYDRIKKL